MSSVTVTLPPDTERTLRAKAVSAGVTLETYIGRLAETDAASGTPSRTATFDAAPEPLLRITIRVVNCSPFEYPSAFSVKSILRSDVPIARNW